MQPDGAQRKLAAILFTDIVGSTAVTARSESSGLALRDRHRALVRTQVERCHGRFIEAPGDESLSTFESAVDAVQAALTIQHHLNDDAYLQVRIGIHLGETIFRGDEVFGDGVNIAARIRELAEPGQVLVSDEIAHAVQNQPNLRAASRGEHELRGVEHPVTVHAVSGTPAEATAVPPVRPESLAAPVWLLPVAAFLLVSLAIGVGWGLYRPTPTDDPIRSIAVLPLENLSGDPEQEYFADGMTEAVISDLAKLKGMRVISRTSVMQYKHARRSLPEIGRELAVDAIVEGSVLRSGDRVRITAQLIDARSDHHLWSESYERDLVDVLQLQAEIANAIALAVAGELVPAVGGGAPIAMQVDPRAFEAYLRGRQYLERGAKSGHRRAVQSFQKAVEIEPEWASAWGALSSALTCSCNWTTPAEGMARARAAAERALELDPQNAEGHTALGLVQFFHDWDRDSAQQSFRRAIELQPSLPWARYGYAVALSITGQAEAAVEQEEFRRALDPLGARSNLANLYEAVGRFEEAEVTREKALAAEPNSPGVLRSVGNAFCARGGRQRGLELLSRARSLEPDDSRALADLAWCTAVSGRHDEARVMLAELDALSAQTYVDPAQLALVHSALGELDAAISELERAVEVRAMYLPAVLRDSRFEALQRDPRFGVIMAPVVRSFRPAGSGDRVPTAGA